MTSSDTSGNLDKGRSFERQAADFYIRNGFNIIARNWRAGHKEIDLIARKGDLVTFIEVKASLTGEYGHPAERVDQRKRYNLISAARQFLVSHDIEGCDLRFDVVTFSGGKLEHFPSAFSADDAE
jgi:putative endonuclease